ncbi:MAG: S9 family peptidase [Candidatus Krumholzibacteriota bacterium]|nr:S9 family peptidase [Candidatus Krumholzibacteriota bacterium]
MFRFEKSGNTIIIFALLVLVSAAPPALGSEEAHFVSPLDLLGIRTAGDARISPCGESIVYTVSVPREASDEPGGAYRELYLASIKTGEIHPFITGKVNIESPRFSPDGSKIAFLRPGQKSGKKQIWMIPVDGGEAVQITDCGTGVSGFRWHPGGERIAYRAIDPACEETVKYDKKGYDFIYYEEDLRNFSIYITGIYEETGYEEKRLTEGVNVAGFEFSPDGKKIAASITPENLIDHIYMFQKINILEIETGQIESVSRNEGKLGNYALSPDGSKLAYTASLDRKDHSVSQGYVLDLTTGRIVNIGGDDFHGHVKNIAWKDNKTVISLAAEGAWNTISTCSASGGKRKIILDGRETGLVFDFPTFTPDLAGFAFTASSPSIPRDLFYWKKGAKTPARMTTLNPWISERRLGRQEVIRYSARDGLEIEGILVYPATWTEGEKYPLIVGVHGGPEAHYSNSWIGSYFNPAQVLAGKGYLVFYPNYRASTGYGVDFAARGYMDAAGKEFDDIADGIDFLVSEGLADRERVGMGGGSYGGYASAWFASYYTRYVRAVCMFVGISDIISKRGTTDIPWEELYVHSGKKLDEDDDQWEFSLKRSPIYYAKQSRTAVLILGGASDTRVHPSQGIEFYRRLKMNGHPAVRMVQYPGEGHGNRKQPGRIDVLYRHLEWYDWYVRDLKPIDGPMPPLFLFDRYGLEPGVKESEKD